MKLNLGKAFCFSLVILVLASGCKKEYESIEELDAKNIETYISQNNLSFTKSNKGIYYDILKEGSGSDVAYSDKVQFVYTVRSLDGSYINIDTVVNHYGGSGQFLGYFTPEPVRTAIKENLKKRGGEIRVLVPSHLAYGRSGSGPIPGNASLDYTVKVLAMNGLPAYDDASIKMYMQTSNLSGFTKLKEGLYYKIIEPGTGSPITQDSVVTVQYKGKLFNGTIFDQTQGTNTATFLLSETVEGFKDAVVLIKEGGSIKVLMSSALGYGLDGSRNQFGTFTIPPFSCLDFEIKVTEVDQP